MKKNILFKATVLIAATVLCSSAAFAKPKVAAKAAPARPVTVDYMGKTDGGQIPQWVQDIAFGDNQAAKQNLGLKSNDYIVASVEERDSFEDLLLKGKILCFVECARSLSCTYELENVSILGSTETNRATSSTTEDKVTKEASYITPFGKMNSSYVGIRYKDGVTPTYSKLTETNVSKMSVTPDGKLNCPAEYQNLFKWFRDEDNVKLNQFWVKMQKPDVSISYNCYTVMSMSREDWETLLQWALSTL